VRALVFDFDGLILDTETAVYTAWSEAFVAHGCAPPTLDEWAIEVGTHRGLDIEGLLRERATIPVDIEAVHTRRRARHDEIIAMEAVLPGVVDWVSEAQARGIAIAIASSSPYDWVHENLERLGIRHYFQHLSCRGNGVPPKPAPDVYVRACDAVGVETSAAIAVEDSPNGIAAAKAAGLRCVAVPNPITASLDFSAADLVLPSLAATALGEALVRLA
jgi:HAD superfamily hydrolase (TIGR01509 family)